jgi:hypothetical protein
MMAEAAPGAVTGQEKKQEQGNEALNKYNEALKYAPNWAELKAATGGAQRKS